MKIPQSDPASALHGSPRMGSPAPVAPSGAGRVDAGSRAGSTAASTPAGDQASLGSSVVALTAQAMSQPEVRADRVQQLQTQLAAGDYSASSTQTADGMLADPLSGLALSGTEEVRG